MTQTDVLRDPAPVARLRGVTRRFDDVTALRSVDLDIPHGTVGLLGPNGAGKSTVFRLLLGLDQADEGTVEVLGQPMPDSALQVLAQVGYMPEDDSLFPDLSGIDQVLRAAQLSGLSPQDAAARAHSTLDLCGLSEARYRPAHGYSLGMRQRLRLAMAVVHGPALLLLDEPTAGLDPDGRAQMLKLIGEIASQRVAVVLSTHILPDVEAVCDQVVLVSGGQVGYCGPIGGFRGGGGGEQWRVRVTGDCEALVRTLLEHGLAASAEGRDVRVRAAQSEVMTIWRACAEAGVGVRKFGPWQDDMRTAFARHLRPGEPIGSLRSPLAETR